jgi:translation initiation factor IF-1
MLRAILKTNLKLWEECLPYIEFAYNRSVHSTTKVSLFQVVYGFNPCAAIDLLPLPPSETTCLDSSQRSEFILKMHETTKLNIEKMNEKYHIAASKGRKEVKLEPGDLVWLHLRKERFLELGKSTFQICDLTWEKKMRCHRGRRQCKRGRMMRTSILQLQTFLPLRYLSLSHNHEHNN